MMMKIRIGKFLTVLVVLTMFVAALTACKPAETPVDEEEVAEEAAVEVEEEEVAEPETEPVIFRIAMTDLWETINPLVAFGWGPRPLLYDRVAAMETMTSVKSGLAESWEVSDDKLVWTFKIREGVTFHDGTPCTAEDIAWSINFNIEHQFPTQAAYVGGMKEAVALDDTTIELTLEIPSRGVASAQLIYSWILPRSVWEGMDYETATSYNEMDAAIGTGPYMLTEYVEDEYIVLDAYEDYWQGKPTIDRVIMQVYTNEDAMVQALIAGEVDMIDELPVQAVEQLKEFDYIEVLSLPALITNYIMLNTYEHGTQPESLMDPQVRLAIAYAVHKQQIINVAFLGYGEVGTIPAPPTFGDLHNPNIVDIPFDPDEGNRILEEAGYLDTDGDGIREDKDGNPMEYRLNTDAGVSGVRLMEIVANGLSQIGIRTFLTEVDDIGSFYPDYDFDIAQWGWWWDPDIEESLRAYTCAEVPDGWNDCGYCNPKYDELYLKQKDATIGDDERREIIWEMQEMFFESRCYITISYDVSLQAYRNDRFTNFITDRFDSIREPESLLQAKPVQ
jgi:peptide/nickel transport system substrate-binding protein